MTDTHSFTYLRELIVFLAAAVLVIPVFHRLKISPVVGYLALGFVIGPFGLGLIVKDVPELKTLVIGDVEGVKALAEFGIVFLLFKIGLELSLNRMWSLRRLVLGLGAAQYFVTAALIASVAYLYGNKIEAAILLGGALAMSSTAIVMQLLYETKRVTSGMGRACFSILIMQDLMVVPLLAMLSVFATPGTISFGAGLLTAVGQAAMAVAVIIVLGRIVLKPIFRWVAAAQSPELLMAVTLLTAIGTALATAAVGLSMALGAFLGGLLLAESEFQHQIEMDIEPFKGLLLGLFFLSVGMSIDIRLLNSAPVLIVLSVLGLFAAKALVLVPAGRLFGLTWPAAIEAALLMGGAGEFGLVAIDLALGRKLLPGPSGHFMLLVASLSMIATPFVAQLGRNIAAWIERKTNDTAGDLKARLGDLSGHVIIAGFGRVGETVGRLLEEEKIPYVAFDSSVEVVTRHRRQGRMIYLGDASRRELLQRAQAGAALAVVVTLDDAATAARLVRNVRTLWLNVPVHVRARDAAHAADLMKRGATHVVPETVEASLQLGGRVLSTLGVPDTAIDARLDRERERLSARLEDGVPVA
ncbi:MAG: cation:proton antiporter [Rhodospirillaceae bacterium]|nr:cation:proton antiporter [Rhodospirillaceae bacterium]